MRPPMKIDAAGLAHLRVLEGCKLVAYWDKTGWALGYGQHDPAFNLTSTCTLLGAETWLQATTETISDRLSDLITVSLNQGQFNVLCIFAYNIGLSHFASSHLLSRLNGGNFDCVPCELARWVYADGQIDSALETRRQAEIALWDEACST